MYLKDSTLKLSRNSRGELSSLLSQRPSGSCPEVLEVNSVHFCRQYLRKLSGNSRGELSSLLTAVPKEAFRKFQR